MAKMIQRPTLYLAHPSSIDYNALYEVLESSFSDFNFICPHRESTNPYPSRILLLEKQVQLVVAEVSQPSTGLGIELGWANAAGVGIIAFAKHGIKVSQSIMEVISTIFLYEKITEIPKLLSLELDFKSER